jgi:protein-tyrosine phosphatase
VTIRLFPIVVANLSTAFGLDRNRKRRFGRHDEWVQTTSRLLPLVGAYNFRDLGGYPTVDGRITRWGRLFRSDTLHELTEADIQVLRDVGLATIVDLRTSTEVERTGQGLLKTEPVGYVHLSVMQEGISQEAAASVSLADLDLASLYLGWLESSPAPLVEAINVIGTPERFPLVFHCAAGKDRTGVLAALILEILGVRRDLIVDDYVLTATRIDLIRVRQRRDPETAQRMDVAPQLFNVEALTMEKFLDGLHERHGGGRMWALDAGVSPEIFERMDATLLGPLP